MSPVAREWSTGKSGLTGYSGSSAGQPSTALNERQLSSNRALGGHDDDDDDGAMTNLRVFISQLASHHNFAVFVAVRLLQVFACTFEKNHPALFLHYLVGDELGQAALGLLISASFVLPHVTVLVATTFLPRVVQ